MEVLGKTSSLHVETFEGAAVEMLHKAMDSFRYTQQSHADRAHADRDFQEQAAAEGSPTCGKSWPYAVSGRKGAGVLRPSCLVV